MNADNYTIVTARERPEWYEAGQALMDRAWPEIMMHDPVAGRYWDRLYQDFPEYQFALFDGDRLVAVGNSLPLVWQGEFQDLPGEGWDWEIEKGFLDLQAGRRANILGALGITIDPDLQGKGLSARMVMAMKAIGRANGLSALIAPVRPNLKSRYPLIPMERYIQWQNADGLPFDPWLRVHARLGAKIIKVCHKAMTISGTIAKWQKWTGMQFPESGTYIIPGALTAIGMDCEADRGVYVEPNVWMVHKIK